MQSKHWDKDRIQRELEHLKACFDDQQIEISNIQKRLQNDFPVDPWEEEDFDDDDELGEG